MESKNYSITVAHNDNGGDLLEAFGASPEGMNRATEYILSDPSDTISASFVSAIENGMIDGTALMVFACIGFNAVFTGQLQQVISKIQSSPPIDRGES